VYHSYGPPGPSIKGLLLFRRKAQDWDPFNTQIIRALCSPLVTLVLLNSNPLDVGLLPPRRGLNQYKTLVCLLFVRPPQNWNHVILYTLLFVDAENTDKTYHTWPYFSPLYYDLGGEWFLLVPPLLAHWYENDTFKTSKCYWQITCKEIQMKVDMRIVCDS
jgi:hypothetical protein